jgi:hypothetical protein
LPKPVLSALVISFLVLAISIGIAIAHDPSEAAHTHQLPSPWPYHMIMVFTGFLSLAGGAFTARYLRQRKGWVGLHKKLVLIGAVFILAGLSIAAYMVSVYMETYFVRETHDYLGISVFAFCHRYPHIGNGPIQIKDKRIRTIHRWSGRITIILMLFTIYVGFQMVLTIARSGM